MADGMKLRRFYKRPLERDGLHNGHAHHLHLARGKLQHHRLRGECLRLRFRLGQRYHARRLCHSVAVRRSQRRVRRQAVNRRRPVACPVAVCR